MSGDATTAAKEAALEDLSQGGRVASTSSHDGADADEDSSMAVDWADGNGSEPPLSTSRDDGSVMTAEGHKKKSWSRQAVVRDYPLRGSSSGAPSSAGASGGMEATTLARSDKGKGNNHASGTKAATGGRKKSHFKTKLNKMKGERGSVNAKKAGSRSGGGSGGGEAKQEESHASDSRTPPSERKKKRDRSLFDQESRSQLALARSLRSTGATQLHAGFNMDLPFGKALSSASEAIARSEEEAAAIAIRMIQEQEEREREEQRRRAKKAKKSESPAPSSGQGQAVNGLTMKRRGRPPKEKTKPQPSASPPPPSSRANVKEDPTNKADSGGGRTGEGGGGASSSFLSPPKQATTSSAPARSAGSGSGKRGPTYSDEPPHRMTFVADKTAETANVLYIRTPPVVKERFDWNSKKFFVVGFVGVGGQRCKPSALQDLQVQYQIYLGQELLYEAQNRAGHTGLYYFRVPHFKATGTYTAKFKALGESHRRFSPLSRQLIVKPYEEAALDSDIGSDEDTAVSSVLLVGGGKGKQVRKRGREDASKAEGVMPSKPPSKEAVAPSASPPSTSTAEAGEGGAGGGKLGRRKRQLTVSVDEVAEEEEGESGESQIEKAFSDWSYRGPLMQLKMPGHLKKQLVDDWFAVTRSRLLVTLPRKPSVWDILQMYHKTTGRRGKTAVADRLCSLFDGCLGELLLYRFEMEQYLEYVGERKKDPAPHQIWGAEHLLRLLMVMPRLLSGTPPTPETRGKGRAADTEGRGSGHNQMVSGSSGSSSQGGGGGAGSSSTDGLKEDAKVVEEYVNGLLVYMEEKRAELFLSKYVEPKQGYGVDVPKVGQR